MQVLFVLIGLWQIGWGILLASLLLRGSAPMSSSGSHASRCHPFILLDTTEIEL